MTEIHNGPDDRSTLRADARRNRDRIITAAKEMFVERGIEAPMEDIAKRAGVGVGTLYRRFPDRDALIRVVAVDNLTAVVADAKAAAAEESTAWGALVRFLNRTSELRLSDQIAPLPARAWAIIRENDEARTVQRRVLDVLAELVRAAQAEGALRSDIGPGDLVVLVSLLLRPVYSTSDQVAPVAAARCVSMLLDGLRATAATPLPGRPLTDEDIDSPR